ncbi:hypothetical protein Vadar_010342 [Vaccinium darrowii]|uniref:Uncharacterized protein n=1 Tax=Vaccinium darrowii TaxID=229202 RepID=A0ACB7YKM0_9ERIC|nr:hypothetical protein Vadar_010342 [Vaccinium darrowii]
MSDQKNQAVQPSSTAEADLESATVDHSKQLRCKKRIKFAALVGLSIIVSVSVIVALDLTILRAKTPKFRLSSVTINHLSFTNTTTSSSPSFNVSFDTVYAVKNPNFAPFYYLDTKINFSYRGNRLGQIRISESKAKALSTKKVGFKVSLSSRAVSTVANLGQDIGSGMVGLSVGSKLRGQVDFIKVIKKDKTPEMNCTMVVNLGLVLQ